MQVFVAFCSISYSRSEAKSHGIDLPWTDRGLNPVRLYMYYAENFEFFCSVVNEFDGDVSSIKILQVIFQY
jgi:hypothetical protein